MYESRTLQRVHFFRFLIATCIVVGGCSQEKTPEPPVVVYAAHDEFFSRPILEQFSRETGIEVAAKYDTESTKTVGLTQAILAEKARPRCNVFWNNEILNTLRLERAGLLAKYHSPQTENFPDWATPSSQTWHGFAARARVLIVNKHRISEARRPKSIDDLIDLQWRDRVGIAKPLFGTTATHVACLLDTWGEEKTRDWLESVKRNCRILSGNRQVAAAVANGKLDFGLTDTDDAMVEIDQGSPVVIVYPDQRADELGTLVIPNTLSILEGTSRREQAERLVDFLLSKKIEQQLADGPSAQIALNPELSESCRLVDFSTVKQMEVDWEAAADKWEESVTMVRDIFTVSR